MFVGVLSLSAPAVGVAAAHPANAAATALNKNAAALETKETAPASAATVREDTTTHSAYAWL